MLGVLTGFAIIAVVIGAGYLVVRVGVVPAGANIALNRVAFFVASPALLFTILADADLQVVFSGFLAVAAISATVASLLFVLASRLLFRMRFGDTVIGSAASGYVNANNIGLPVAVYVIGDPQFVAPVLLFQLIVFAPIVLGLLDANTRGRLTVLGVITQPLRNPIIIGSVLGLVVSLTGVELPAPVLAPLELLAGAAVPLVLLAFGMSLRGQKPMAAGSQRRAIVTSTVIKSIIMPGIAFLLAEFVFHLSTELVVAATIMAALPSAQNINNYAVRYDRGVMLARDVVLLSTLMAIPVIFVLAWLMHAGT
ncbi:MAG: AEC family transporter [Microbacteriaceae bacterium]